MTTEMNGSGEMLNLLGREFNLPSPPAVAVQILNTVQNSESSMTDLELIITADPALSVKMLKIANSAFYALPYQITNVARALSILGTNIIKNIALSFVIAKDLQGSDDSGFDFQYFWRRSVIAAVAAELLSFRLKRKDENIFVTSLLQDVGILILYLAKGQDYVRLLTECQRGSGTGIAEEEQKRYRFDHQQIGHLLLNSWKIPEVITTPIRYHHCPELAQEPYRGTAQVLQGANLLSAIYCGSETAQHVRQLQELLAEAAGFSQEQVRDLIDEVARKSFDVLEIFDIDPGQMKPYTQMLQEANEELGRLNLSYEQLVLELQESKKKAERFANDLKAANSRLEELAFRDGLTNLYNHRYFQEQLSIEMARAQRYKHPLSVILFDLDFFKKVNDAHGHVAGDQVLANIATIIVKAVRPSDIVARYGGEEFAVILPETSQSGLKVFAERLRRSVAATETTVNSTPINVTISLGATSYIPDVDTIISKQQFIDTADRALYLSKQKGRDQCTILPLVGGE